MNTDKVNRVEVIDHTLDFGAGGGRCYVKWNRDNSIKVEAVLQDDDRTLKIFITKK